MDKVSLGFVMNRLQISNYKAYDTWFSLIKLSLISIICKSCIIKGIDNSSSQQVSVALGYTTLIITV